MSWTLSTSTARCSASTRSAGPKAPLDRVEIETQWLVSAARGARSVSTCAVVNIYMSALGKHRRDLQARLVARTEDDLLPAHPERDQRREVDGEVEPAQRSVERQSLGGDDGRRVAGGRVDVEPRERHDARVRCEVLRARQPRVRSVPVIANAMRQSNIHAAMQSISLGLSHRSLG